MICVIFNLFDDPNDPSRLMNLRFFLKHGLKGNGNVVCHIIYRNPEIPKDMPDLDNLYYHHFHNVGYCINGFKHAINTVDLDNCDYVFFMNDSVIGPFVKHSRHSWHESFTKRLRAGIKLVSHYGSPEHICTACFVVDKAGLKVLRTAYSDFGNITTAKDAHDFETRLPSLFSREGFSCDTLFSTWHAKHDVFDVVFEKRNRVGVCNSHIFNKFNCRSKKKLCYISEEELAEAIKHMDSCL